jgi:hypothetical protein
MWTISLGTNVHEVIFVLWCASRRVALLSAHFLVPRRSRAEHTIAAVEVSDLKSTETAEFCHATKYAVADEVFVLSVTKGW